MNEHLYERLKELREELREVSAADKTSAEHLGKAEAMVIALATAAKAELMAEVKKWGEGEAYGKVNDQREEHYFDDEIVASKYIGEETVADVVFKGDVWATPHEKLQTDIDAKVRIVEADGTETEVSKFKIQEFL